MSLEQPRFWGRGGTIMKTWLFEQKVDSHLHIAAFRANDEMRGRNERHHLLKMAINWLLLRAPDQRRQARGWIKGVVFISTFAPHLSGSRDRCADGRISHGNVSGIKALDPILYVFTCR